MIDLELVKLLINKKSSDGNYVFTGYLIEKETGFSRDLMSKLRKKI